MNCFKAIVLVFQLPMVLEELEEPSMFVKSFDNRVEWRQVLKLASLINWIAVLSRAIFLV